jgi:transposase
MRRNKLLEFFASLLTCVVGLEASGSAHHWARELIKIGHEARMMPPAYVKPYIRRQKNDASDAATTLGRIARVARSCGLVVAWASASMFLFKALPLL